MFCLFEVVWFVHGAKQQASRTMNGELGPFFAGGYMCVGVSKVSLCCLFVAVACCFFLHLESGVKKSGNSKVKFEVFVLWAGGQV
jgi:hypothetical protein